MMKKFLLVLLLSLSYTGKVLALEFRPVTRTTPDGCKFILQEDSVNNMPFAGISADKATCVNGYLNGEVLVKYKSRTTTIAEIRGPMTHGVFNGIGTTSISFDGKPPTVDTNKYIGSCIENFISRGICTPIDISQYQNQSTATTTSKESEDANKESKNTRASEKKHPDDASHCIKIDAENSQFRNTCDFKVSVGYCTLYPRGTTNDIYSQYSCRRLGAEQAEWDNQLVINAHGSAMYENDGRDADGVYHVACESPNRPLGITYSSTRKPVLQAKDCRYD